MSNGTDDDQAAGAQQDSEFEQRPAAAEGKISGSAPAESGFAGYSHALPPEQFIPPQGIRYPPDQSELYPPDAYGQPAAQPPYPPHAYASDQSYPTGQSYPPGQPGTGQWPAPEPTRRRKLGKGAIAGIIVAAAVFVLVGIGIVGYVVLAGQHTPQSAVAGYLNALKGGDAATAARLGGIEVTSKDVLLTNKAYRASTDHIQAWLMDKPVVNGDNAAVTVAVKQGDQRYTQSFSLVKAGKDMVVFDHWKLKPVPLGSAVVRISGPSASALKIAGASVSPSSSAVSLRAFPGVYPVQGDKGNQYYTMSETKAQVLGFTSARSRAGSLAATLTDAGTKAATDAVNKYLDACAASTDFEPSRCPFGTTGAQTDTYTYTDQKWTLDPRPTFTIGSWLAGGWMVSTTAPGSATFSANFAGNGSQGTASAGPLSVRVRGLITGFDSSGATFEPLIF